MWQKAAEHGICNASLPRTLSIRLFNHPDRLQHDRLWNLDAKRLGGFQVDHQLVCGGLLKCDIGGLGTFENPVYEQRGAPEKTGRSGPYDIRPPRSGHAVYIDIAGRRCCCVNSATRPWNCEMIGEDN